MNAPIVQMQAVEKVYKQGSIDVHALRGLDLEVHEGEFTAICGPSGSGKTTALNLIGALDKATSGIVKVAGRDLAGMGAMARSKLRRDRIGFVFQSYNLIPVLSAYENAISILSLQGANKKEAHERVMELLHEVGLEGMEKRRPHELSGGQQQRVAIVRAIAAKPAVVLADEPTANVDSETAERLLDVMEKLNKEHGVTFVFSTHDPRVMKRARRIVMLVDGKVASDETREG
jgi:putative ABC transport system ATP-binding protein